MLWVCVVYRMCGVVGIFGLKWYLAPTICDIKDAVYFGKCVVTGTYELRAAVEAA